LLIKSILIKVLN